jgi:helicase
MDNTQVFTRMPNNIKEILFNQNIKTLRPSQEKAIKNGLFLDNKNQIISSPTASGKTLVAEMAMLDTILNKKKKVIYIVPLKALASEKYKEFLENYKDKFKIRISIGDIQNEKYNYDYDLLLVTAEKLDSLIRNNTDFISNTGLLIVDEIHLLNDEKRGPTLEIILSIFKTKFVNTRIIGLSATIGNAKEISKWLNANLIEDNWRPVTLEYHVLYENELSRYK